MSDSDSDLSDAVSLLESGYSSISIPALLANMSYGGYVVLFTICMYIMRCKSGTVPRMHQVAIVSLFALATLGFIFGNIEENASVKLFLLPRTTEMQLQELLNDIGNTVVFGLYTLANAIADFVLIHRCYKIWGCKKRVIAFPVFISVVNNGLALFETIMDAIAIRAQVTQNFDMMDSGTMVHMQILGDDFLISFLAINLLANLVIPFMIAGRIWWIGRQASKFIGKNSLTRRTVAICLESGMIYPLFLIPTLAVYLCVFGFNFLPLLFLGDLMPMLTQVVGIAPTFIIVRVALGISIENVQDTVAREKEGNSGGQQTQTLMMVFEDSASTGASV